MSEKTPIHEIPDKKNCTSPDHFALPHELVKLKAELCQNVCSDIRKVLLCILNF